MRVFLSHATHDGPLASFIASAVAPRLGVSFFTMPDGAPFGREWMTQIRQNMGTCDALWSLVTPESAQRPWISAEWAAFWLQDKPTTSLLVDIGVEGVWEPMRAFQAVAAGDLSAVTQFLKEVADQTGRVPPEGVHPLAKEIVDEIPAVRRRQATRDADEVVARVGRTLVSGPDVRADDVLALVRHDRVPALVELARQVDAAPVRQRQVAVALVAADRFEDAVAVAESIPNRSEVRTVAWRIVDRVPRGASADSPHWQALERLYHLLGTPQRRDVVGRMAARGVTPLGSWATWEAAADLGPVTARGALTGPRSTAARRRRGLRPGRPARARAAGCA